MEEENGRVPLMLIVQLSSFPEVDILEVPLSYK